MPDRFSSEQGRNTQSIGAARGGRAGKRFARCILHIGTEKTGTTSIQHFLSANRKALLRRGVVYPQSAGSYGGSQWEFVALAHEAPWAIDVGRRLGLADAEASGRFLADFKGRLAAELARSGRADTLLISSEHMQSRLQEPAQIERLKAFLAPLVDRFEVLVYLRRQDRVSVSSFMHQIRMGQDRPSLFPAGPQNRPPYLYDYEGLFDNWSGVFGADAIRLRLFERNEWVGGELVSDFCAACGIGTRGLRLPAPQNESVSLPAAQFMGELNRQLPWSEAGIDHQQRDAFLALVGEQFRADAGLVARKNAQAFYQKFAASNERLRAKALPSRIGPLFSEDFSDYPEVANPLTPPSHADAVAIAYALWQRRIIDAPTGWAGRLRRAAGRIARRFRPGR